MLSSDNATKKDYIPWLFASSSSLSWGQYLHELQATLQQEGLWEKIWESALKMRLGFYGHHAAKMVEVDAKLAAGEQVHKDIVKMRELQVEKALLLRDEDVAMDVPLLLRV